MGSGLLERDLQKVVPVISVKPKGRAGCRGSCGSGNEITATRGAKEGQSKPWSECFSEASGACKRDEGMFSLSVQPNLLCLFSGVSTNATCPWVVFGQGICAACGAPSQNSHG